MIYIRKQFSRNNSMLFKRENKREHYRIRYPLACRPILKIGYAKYEVMDISEKGVKFNFSAYRMAPPGTQINAYITFHDGRSLKIEGELIRVNRNFATAILKLKESIPWKRILNEQRFLKEKYPELPKK